MRGKKAQLKNWKIFFKGTGKTDRSRVLDDKPRGSRIKSAEFMKNESRGKDPVQTAGERRSHA